MHLNFEFKAQHNYINFLEKKLQKCDPVFVGEDHQVDTYFNVAQGRLKLREGTIEQALIFYDRPDDAGAKQSNVLLYNPKPDPALKEILTRSLGIKTVVDKTRKIYFVNNVKIHFDTVKELGTFIEVEAIDKDGSIGIGKLKEQCFFFKDFFGVNETQFIAKSYSDLVLVKKSSFGTSAA